MKIIPAIIVTLVTATAIAGATAFAVTMDPRRSLMSAPDYGYEKRALESQGREAYARCRAREEQAMVLCKAEAITNERVSKADLEAQYRGTTAAFEQAQRVRAQAQYDVARVKCAPERGARKFSCLQGARSAMTSALAEAELASV